MKQSEHLTIIFTDVEEGDVLMIASSRYIRKPDGSDRIPQVLDALETLIYGEVTNGSILRSLRSEDEDTYALVFQKGRAIVYFF